MKKSASNSPTESQVIDALKTVFDPEIPVNVYDLGLIYGFEIKDDGQVHITMTLTNPNCPMAEEMPANVEKSVKKLECVKDAIVTLVFEPPWSEDNMSDAAKLELGLL